MFSRFCKFIGNLYRRFIDDDVLALGSPDGLLFGAIFFPFLVFLIALISYSPVSSRQVLEGLLGILPEEAYVLVRDTLEEIGGRKNGGLASISGVLSLWFASNGIGAIITGLNKAYDERERRSFIRVKLISSSSPCFFPLPLCFHLPFWYLVGHKEKTNRRHEPYTLYQGLWDIGRYIFIASVILLIFIILYRYTPSRRMGWREVVPGAIFSTAGWLITSLGFAYYVDNFGHYSTFYGSIGGVVILLIWLYFSAVIILIGGELNAALVYNGME